jgi:hypothetical protein
MHCEFSNFLQRSISLAARLLIGLTTEYNPVDDGVLTILVSAIW